MPITLGQELGGWSAQIRSGVERIQHAMPAMKKLAIGGTAVGTGINAPEEFGSLVADFLEQQTGLRFSVADNRFENMSSQDAAVALSGQLKTLAVSLLKI